MPAEMTEDDLRRIDDATRHFADNRRLFETAAESLNDCLSRDADLRRFIHFMKYRIKEPDSLRAKLKKRTLSRGRGSVEDAIDASNLFEKITDLAGLRIIHLHINLEISMLTVL